MAIAKPQNLKTEVLVLSPKDKLNLQVKVPPCLVLVGGDDQHAGRQWILDRASVLLGRAPEAEICLSEGGLSKTHARFSCVNDQVSVVDLGSTNKTFVNGQELAPNQPKALKNNDMVQTGKLFFKFLQKGVVSETAEKERMQSELEKARNIQNSLLPTKSEAVYGTVRIGGRYRSASECSGDWWWHWAKGDRAFAIIGDVTGHGVGAALITSAARSAVAALEDDSSAAIENVYTTLARALHKCSAGKIVMSAFMIEYDFKKAVLRFINASHLPAVLMSSQDGEMSMVDGKAAPPLGSGSEEFEVVEAKIGKNHRLVLLTDGLTERKTITGAVMRETAFYRMLVKAHADTRDNQSAFLNELMAKSDALSGNAPQDDDITVVAVDFL